MLGVSQLFGALTGAESALIVNNGAAALLLALTALAAGREVLVSRGELVEIGGGFRVPEVVAAGGARLVEVGTTNRTRVEDFARAITPQTAVILSVHPSNFRITGFTERPDRADLADLARQHGLRFVEDAGSGAVEAIGDEPLLRDVVTHADVVTCSGDKLLGGPQAGIILGRTEAISTLSAHPLLRALRVDKVTMAALEATLAGWLTGARPPAAEMLAASPDALRRRSLAFIQALGAGEIVDGAGLPGGGALPGVTLEGPVVRLSTPDPERTLRRLREGATPVIARVSDGAVTLDLRTVPADDTPGLVEAVRAATVEAPS
jgi:L-seryl-tRNA(Ser) seleniumtransferase